MAKTRKKREPTTPSVNEAEGEPTRGATLRPDEMSADVLEFITAVDEYKRIHRRPFPTWSEVLDIVKSLGYARAR